MAEAFTRLSGFHWIIDDIIIYDNNATEHAHHVKAFFQQYADRQITLNLDRCHFFHYCRFQAV